MIEETMVSHWLIDSSSSALSSQHPQTLRIFPREVKNINALPTELAEHWASIPKVIGSIPTVTAGIFFKPARCGYSNTLRVA